MSQGLGLPSGCGPGEPEGPAARHKPPPQHYGKSLIINNFISRSASDVPPPGRPRQADGPTTDLWYCCVDPAFAGARGPIGGSWGRG
jgi:hypothetical protein